jgi:anti-sigma B factor antagonist
MQHTTTPARLFSRRTSGHTVLAVIGELDIATTASLRDRIVNVLKETTSPVIIDLSGVSFCDATGLALLVGAQRRAKLHGLSIVLAGPRRNVSKLLRITGLDRAFTIYPSVAGATLGQRPIDRPAVA